MKPLSTLFQRNETDSFINKIALRYAPIDVDLPNKSEALDILTLQWSPNQHIVSLPQSTFYNNIGKRIFDILVAAFTLLFILSWLIPILGILILTDSKGPILFIQTRSGRKGKPFRCLKFRTMTHVPRTYKDFSQTAYNDTRVTPLGRFLRRTNLDEMPQFINVLLGDMSLVGPRPHAIPHDAMHWDSPAYQERYWVRPGITGLAQIRGSRGATSKSQQMAHRVRYDHLYIARQTFGLDMKICYQTLKLMLRGDRNAW